MHVVKLAAILRMPHANQSLLGPVPNLLAALAKSKTILVIKHLNIHAEVSKAKR